MKRSGLGAVNEDPSGQSPEREARVVVVPELPELPCGQQSQDCALLADARERQQILQALSEKAEFLDAIIENEPECVKLVDRQGQLVRMNRAGLEMLEATSLQEAQQCVLADYVHESERAAFIDLHARVCAGESGTCTFRIRGLHGGERWLETHAAPLHRHDGEVLLLGITRDVTLRMQVQAALQASEGRFRLMFERSADALLLLDADAGQFIDCNQATVDMLRCHDKSEVLAMHPARLSPPQQADGRDSRDKANEMIATALRLGSHRFEWTHCSTHRRDFPVEVLLTPLVIDQRQLLLTTWRDISERKRDELWRQHFAGILDAISTETPLADLLQRLAGFIDQQDESLHGLIVRLAEDGRRLRVDAAPGLPAELLASINASSVASRASGYGRSSATPQVVASKDLLADPRWSAAAQLALDHGLQGCWSQPMFSADRRMLGSFNIACRQARAPVAHELELLERSAALAALAIERAEHQQEQRLARAVFEQSAEGFMVTDPLDRILMVNRAFERISGFAAADVVGRSADCLRSGRHDAGFEQSIIDALNAEGRWQGEYWSRHRSGAVHPLLKSVANVRDGSGKVTHRIHIMADISDQKVQAARIEQLAFYDPLTGLPNRALLLDRLAQALALAQRREQRLALLFMDLDRFKEINDSLGHAVGDIALAEVTQRFQDAVREGDTLARMGGDEFVLLAENVDQEQASLIAERLAESLRVPIMLQGRPFSMGVSIGIAFYPDDGDCVADLLKHTDIAMYRAKAEGGGFRFYQATMGSELGKRLRIASRLEAALQRGVLQLHYQPQIDLADGSLIGAEALLRWFDDEEGWMSPGEFVPIAEARGLMVPLGDWVVAEACRQLVAWQTAGYRLPGRLALNLSAQQLHQPQIAERLQLIVGAAGLRAEQFELELTESSMIVDPQAAIATTERLARAGFALSIDDFGTGYSSLTYLRQFSASQLKIDKSFVRDMLNDSNDYAIVAATIAMAHGLGMRTVAEGTERPEQAAALRALGCEVAQGYLYGRPVGGDEFAETWLRVKDAARET